MILIIAGKRRPLGVRIEIQRLFTFENQDSKPYLGFKTRGGPVVIKTESIVKTEIHNLDFYLTSIFGFVILFLESLKTRPAFSIFSKKSRSTSSFL